MAADSTPNAPQTIDIDGKPVPIEEVRKGYLRQADYTKKTQALADERRQLERSTGLLGQGASASMRPQVGLGVGTGGSVGPSSTGTVGGAGYNQRTAPTYEQPVGVPAYQPAPSPSFDPDEVVTRGDLLRELQQTRELTARETQQLRAEMAAERSYAAQLAQLQMLENTIPGFSLDAVNQQLAIMPAYEQEQYMNMPQDVAAKLIHYERVAPLMESGEVPAARAAQTGQGTSNRESVSPPHAATDLSAGPDLPPEFDPNTPVTRVNAKAALAALKLPSITLE